MDALDNLIDDIDNDKEQDNSEVILNHIEDKEDKEVEKVEETNEEKVEETNEEKEISGKPWKIDEKGKKVSTMVPKERFDEKNNLAKELEIQLRDRERRLAEIEENNKKINVDLSHIKLEDFNSFEDYMKAMTTESNKIQRQLVKEEMENEKALERVRVAERNLIDGFDRNLAETQKEIPDIVNVVQEFSKYKEYFPKETIYTLMGDENSAKVIHEIMTTENLLKNLSELSPVQAARMIGKISAKIDLQKDTQNSFSNNRSENSREIPANPISSQKPKVAGTPNLKGASDKSAVRENISDSQISKKEAKEFAELFGRR